MIFLSAVEKIAIQMKKRRPTRAPIFQGSMPTIPARKLQEMKLAARHAGQGMDRAQKVFLDMS